MADDDFISRVFLKGRTHRAWQEKPVPETVLREVYDLAALAPTAYNSSPARFAFVSSREGKERLRPALNTGNVDKTMSAPVTVIVSADTRFYETLPASSSGMDAKILSFKADPVRARDLAMQNAWLQAGFLMTAARALGLDCGPLTGFDNVVLDDAYFADGRLKSLLLINMGYGKAEELGERRPRLSFDEVCKLV